MMVLNEYVKLWFISLAFALVILILVLYGGECANPFVTCVKVLP